MAAVDLVATASDEEFSARVMMIAFKSGAGGCE